MAAPTAAGLGELARLRRRPEAMGGRLVLVNVGPLAYEFFRAAGLARLVDARQT